MSNPIELRGCDDIYRAGYAIPLYSLRGLVCRYFDKDYEVSEEEAKLLSTEDIVEPYQIAPTLEAKIRVVKFSDLQRVLAHG